MDQYLKDSNWIHTKIPSIASFRLTELPAIHLEVAPSRKRLSPIFLVVAESSEDSNYQKKRPWTGESPSATFVSTVWTTERRTASLLMFQRHCEQTMEVSRLLEPRIVLKGGPRRKEHYRSTTRQLWRLQINA